MAFIDNGNVLVDDLRRDGIHLLETRAPANNYIHALSMCWRSTLCNGKEPALLMVVSHPSCSRDLCCHFDTGDVLCELKTWKLQGSSGVVLPHYNYWLWLLITDFLIIIVCAWYIRVDWNKHWPFVSYTNISYNRFWQTSQVRSCSRWWWHFHLSARDCSKSTFK